VGPLGLVPTRLDDGGLQLYGEVGIATRLAVVADFQPLHSLRLARGGSDVTAVGTGDLDAGLKLLLFDEEVTCSLQATLGIPTGRSDAALPLGTGDLRGAFVLSIGHVWDRVPLFFSVDLGAIVRSSGDQRVNGVTTTIDYASELVYAGELGYLAKLSERVRLTPRVRLDGQHGVRKPTTPVPSDLIDAPIAPESVRFVRVTAGIGVDVALSSRARGPVTHLLVDATGGAFVWGEGLPAAGQVSLGFGLKR
jgi:hypothetical protein